MDLGALSVEIEKIVAAEVERRIQEIVRLSKEPTYLLVSEASVVARNSPGTIRRWIREGKLNRYASGRHILVKFSELRDFIEVGKAANELDLCPEAMALRDFGQG